MIVKLIQIRPLLLGPQQTLLMPPFVHLLVISGKQDGRHMHAHELLRAGILRIFQKPV